MGLLAVYAFHPASCLTRSQKLLQLVQLHHRLLQQLVFSTRNIICRTFFCLVLCLQANKWLIHMITVIDIVFRFSSICMHSTNIEHFRMDHNNRDYLLHSDNGRHSPTTETILYDFCLRIRFDIPYSFHSIFNITVYLYKFTLLCFD